MRHIFSLITLSMSFISLAAFAQTDSSGIYQTGNDFKNKNLTYAINYKTEKHRIKDGYFLNDKEIKVVHHDTTYMLEKSSTYGFKDSKGKTFRFIGDNSYEILNPDEAILIYKFNTSINEAKGAPTRVVLYFFTKDALNPPVELTKVNLKNTFPDNHHFHDALDENFKKDEELTSYDDFHHMYKINWLYENASK